MTEAQQTIHPELPFEVALSDAPNQMTWHEAVAYAKALGQNWRLPTLEELGMIYRNRDTIPGLKISGTDRLPIYWSSTERNRLCVWLQLFTNGDTSWDNRNTRAFLRLVRDASP